MHGLPSSLFVSAMTAETLLCLSPPRGGTDLALGGEILGRVE